MIALIWPQTFEAYKRGSPAQTNETLPNPQSFITFETGMTAERSRWEEWERADGRRTVNGGSTRSEPVHCTTIRVSPQAHLVCFPYWPVPWRVQVESISSERSQKTATTKRLCKWNPKPQCDLVLTCPVDYSQADRGLGLVAVFPIICIKVCLSY